MNKPNKGKKEVTAKGLVVIIKSSQNKCYSVALTKNESEYIQNAIQAMHGGHIKVFEKEIEGINLIKK